MTPSMAWPLRSLARYENTVTLRLILRDAEDLRHRGQPRTGPGPAVLSERHHAMRDRLPANLGGGRLPHDEAADGLGDPEQLVDPGAPAVAGAAAFVAALAVEELLRARGLDTEGEDLRGLRRLGHPTGMADPPHQPLGQHAVEHGRE